jgi:hypothetical protein
MLQSLDDTAAPSMNSIAPLDLNIPFKPGAFIEEGSESEEDEGDELDLGIEERKPVCTEEDGKQMIDGKTEAHNKDRTQACEKDFGAASSSSGAEKRETTGGGSGSSSTTRNTNAAKNDASDLHGILEGLHQSLPGTFQVSLLNSTFCTILHEPI